MGLKNFTGRYHSPLSLVPDKIIDSDNIENIYIHEFYIIKYTSQKRELFLEYNEKNNIIKYNVIK